MAGKNVSSHRVGPIGFFICLVLTLAALAGTGLNIRGLFQEQEDLKSRKLYTQDVLKEIASLEEFISLYNGEQEKLGEILFSDQDIATFLEEISLFAQQSKVNIVNMRTKPFVPVRRVGKDEKRTSAAKEQEKEQTKPQIQAMPIDIQVEGEFRPLVDFLIHLEKHRQLITLTNVEIKLKKYPQLTCSFILSIYSLKQMSGGQGI